MLLFKEFPSILEALACIILLSILKFYYGYFTRSTPYPGPLPLPIVGNLHLYFYHRNDIPYWFHRLSLQYGDVYELYFGSSKCLMISNLRVVERVMNTTIKDNNYFVRVATKKGLDELNKGRNGILYNADFNSWSYARKIFIRTMAAPNTLRIAVKLVDDTLKDLEKIWIILIEEQGQFLNDEKEKSLEIDFMPWAKRIFAETTMFLTVGK